MSVEKHLCALHVCVVAVIISTPSHLILLVKEALVCCEDILWDYRIHILLSHIQQLELLGRLLLLWKRRSCDCKVPEGD
jgi:hypothetical protein